MSMPSKHSVSGHSSPMHRRHCGGPASTHSGKFTIRTCSHVPREHSSMVHRFTSSQSTALMHSCVPASCPPDELHAPPLPPAPELDADPSLWLVHGSEPLHAAAIAITAHTSAIVKYLIVPPLVANRATPDWTTIVRFAALAHVTDQRTARHTRARHSIA